jgi:hypothetical protein
MLFDRMVNIIKQLHILVRLLRACLVHSSASFP